MADFEDLDAFNFTLKAGAIDACSSEFQGAFRDIPISMIGVRPSKYSARFLNGFFVQATDLLKQNL